MIPRDIEGKVEFMGRTLPECVTKLRQAGYKVNVFTEGNELKIEVQQTLTIPLGLPSDIESNWPRVLTEKTHGPIGPVGDETTPETTEGSGESEPRTD